MNRRDAAPMTLAELPDALVLWSPTTGEVTVGEIRSERVRLITTKEAARLFSYTPVTWARWAPTIPGAFKDRMWRLPLEACEAHVAAHVAPPQARLPRRVGPSPDRGPPIVGAGSQEDAESGNGWLARRRRAYRAPGVR